MSHNQFQKIPEILAPAGGRAQFFAALNAGADAVYLGLNEFNARARAENFTFKDLHELVPVAHKHGMQVLVTVNILLKDAELGRLIDFLADLEIVGVDALIIQDLGVANIVRRFFPGLRMHASTQMAVHNLAGVKQVAAWGFKRVVVAREITATELRKIQTSVDLEEIQIEAFCHGSLCYSYSGLCFFSGANDARSGNRGECAYTCRKPYKVLNEAGYGFLFSMKDLDTSEHLDAFLQAGVHTLKIEGRKKDAQYVATVVRLYRQKLNDLAGCSTGRGFGMSADTVLNESLREDLEFSYQRKATSFFLKDRYRENVIDLDNPTHQGRPIGEVIAVQRASSGQVRAKIKLSGSLARFDGVKFAAAKEEYHALPQHGAEVAAGKTIAKLAQRYRNEEAQISVRNMMVDGQRVVNARADQTVAVELPDDVMGLVKPGMRVYKLRSSDLKQRIDALSHPPAAVRLRPELLIDLVVTVTKIQPDAPAVIAIKGNMQGLFTVVVSADVAGHQSQDAISQVQTLREQLKVIGPRASEEAEGEAQPPFFVTDSFTYHNPEQWFVPPSLLKKLKHELRAALLEAVARHKQNRRALASAFLETPTAPRPAGPVSRAQLATQLAIKFDRPEYFDYLRAMQADGSLNEQIVELVFEPKRHAAGPDARAVLSEFVGLCQHLGVRPRLAVPAVVRAWDEPLLKLWFRHGADLGVHAFELANVGGWVLLQEWGLDLTSADLSGDFTLYSMNRAASSFWSERGLRTLSLSVEDDLTNISQQLSGWSWKDSEPQAIVFKDTPLFIAEACSLTALHNGCPTAKVCGYRTLHIENTDGETFYIGHESCKSIVYAENAFSITEHRQRLEALGIRKFRVDFLSRPYSSERIRAVIAAACDGHPLPHTQSANFLRRLL